MTIRTIKMMIMFFVAATFINLINFIFSWLYYPTLETLPMTRNGFPGLPQQIVDKFIESGYVVTESTLVLSSDASSNQSEDEQLKNLGEVIKSSDRKNVISKRNVTFCPEIPYGLGPITYNVTMFRQPSQLYAVEYDSEIMPGGYNKLKICTPQERAAIIVPITGTETFIEFVYYLHSFLRKQQLEYQMFVVEQRNGVQPFNRGKLLNAVFREVNRQYPRRAFHCFIIHDPTILPVDTRNLYRCSWNPRQLAAKIEKDVNNATEPTFGGAVAFTHEQFIKVNGFSNVYSTNDTDFTDLFKRFSAADYAIERTSPVFGSYITIGNETFSEQSKVDLTESPMDLKDGLSSLSYIVNSFKVRDFYTYIQFSFPAPDNFRESDKDIKFE